jgi:hypothetical protein
VSLTAKDMAAHIEAAEKKLGLEAVWQKALAGGQTVAETFALPPAK